MKENDITLLLQMKLKLFVLTDINCEGLPIQLECFYVIREFQKGFRNNS